MAQYLSVKSSQSNGQGAMNQSGHHITSKHASAIKGHEPWDIYSTYVVYSTKQQTHNRRELHLHSPAHHAH